MASLSATKPLHTLMNEAQDTSEHGLKRTLGPVTVSYTHLTLPTIYSV